MLAMQKSRANLPAQNSAEMHTNQAGPGCSIRESCRDTASRYPAGSRCHAPCSGQRRPSRRARRRATGATSARRSVRAAPPRACCRAARARCGCPPSSAPTGCQLRACPFGSRSALQSSSLLRVHARIIMAAFHRAINDLHLISDLCAAGACAAAPLFACWHMLLSRRHEVPI